MKTRELTDIDKSAWGHGPWQDEPDAIEWVDETTGLICFAFRTKHFGTWCGYVGVSKGHPAFGMKYEDLHVDVDVHGGLTFGEFHTGPGGHEDIFWLGFDCTHFGDRMPGYEAASGKTMPHATYRTLEFVKDQCRNLAQQLKAWGVSARRSGVGLPARKSSVGVEQP